MMTLALEVKLIVALAALGVSIYLWHWRRTSRAEWSAYDAKHHHDKPLRPSAASERARDDDGNDD